MARSGDTILNSLYNNAINRDLLPDMLPKTRIGLLFAVIAGEDSDWETVLENFKKEDFIETATLIDNVEKIAAPFYARIDERASDVIVKITWKEGTTDKSDITFTYGTVIQTGDTDPVQYQLVEEVILYRTASIVHARARSINTGADTMIAAGAIESFATQQGSVEVTNEEASWGGRDAEPIETTRANAMASRYSLVKGTSDQIGLLLSQQGLSSSQYNIVDTAYGMGSFAVFIDTESEEYLKEITNEIKIAKAEGIYLVVDSAEKIDMSFEFTISVVNDRDVTPQERDNIKKDITAGVKDFITSSGVGQKVVLSHLTHYLYDQYLDKYNMFEINIDESQVDSNYLDENGNIAIEPYQVINVDDISITVKTG